jgi:predicted  nucleic acid-binding Zn-ribbon protein
MANTNVIEEYLVSLGAIVNNAQFSEFNNTLNKAKSAVTKLSDSAMDTTTSLGKMVTGLSAVASAITAVGFATAKTIKSVADADMKYQVLAKDIWTTKENAKSLQLALDTMGAKLEDVAWIPELREQFLRLRSEMQELQTPADANNQLKYIRSIGYEWQSFMLKIKMLKEWVAYYLIKYLAGPIERVRQGLKDINENLKMNMPSWGNKIAKVLTVVNLGMNLARFGKTAIDTISRFFNMLPEGAQKIIKFISIIGMAIKLNPFFAAMSIMILLIDDFYAYIDGRKSARTLAPVWKKLLEVWDGLQVYFEKGERYLQIIISLLNTEALPALTNWWSTFKQIMDNLVEIFFRILEILKYMFQDFDVIGLFMLMGDSVSSLVDGVLDLVEAILELIAKLFGLSVKGKEVWWAFGKGIENTLRLMTRLVRLTGDLFSALAKAARGDFKGAFKQVIRAFGNFGEGILDDVTKGKVGDASDDARSERAQYIMRRLINGGLTPVQAAGIVGNWIQESSLNPETVNGIGASGIGQWLGSRRENLITFASNRGKDWTDLDTQIDFALWEMNEGGEFFNIDGARDDFYSTNSPSKAAVAFRKGYERPGKSEANDSNRINKAETAFDEWNKTNPSSNYDYTDANKSSGPVHLNNNKLEVDDFYTPPKEDYSQYFEKTGFSGFLGQGTYAHSLIGGSGMPIMTTANNYNGSSVNIGQINVTAPNGTEPMTAKDVAGAVKKVIPDVNIGGIGNNARDIRNISGVIV